jgi:chemotaxis protein methyltransferase CheR
VRWEGWKIDILGTDISRGAVERARSGLYSQFEIQRGLPVMQMIRWFEEYPAAAWRVAPAIRGAVRFHVHNVLDAPPAPGSVDIVLCRNVLLYFSAQTRRAAFARLAEAGHEGAVLMLGAGETVSGHSPLFVQDPECRGLYVRADARRARSEEGRARAAS